MQILRELFDFGEPRRNFGAGFAKDRSGSGVGGNGRGDGGNRWRQDRSRTGKDANAAATRGGRHAQQFAACDGAERSALASPAVAISTIGSFFG